VKTKVKVTNTNKCEIPSVGYAYRVQMHCLRQHGI